MSELRWSQPRLRRAISEYDRYVELGEAEALRPDRLPRDLYEVHHGQSPGPAYAPVSFHAGARCAESERLRQQYKARYSEEIGTRRPWATPTINSVIFKVVSRCNLKCDYCYMYTKADQSWRAQPRFVSDSVVGALAQRISEYLDWARLPGFEVILHGGEPLLLGPDRLRRVLEIIRSGTSGEGRPDVTFALQTNATLIDDQFVSILDEYSVGIGVSLDGDLAANDLHRLDHSGESSLASTLRGLGVLRERGLSPNLLAVIDPRNDAAETVSFLAGWCDQEFDLLLPDANWDEPPAATCGEDVPYGRWLAQAFDAWLELPGNPPSIRYFLTILRLLTGSHGVVDSLGGSGVSFLSVETDGTIHDVDTLKATFEGATNLHFSVAASRFDEVLDSDRVAERVRDSTMCAVCAECEWAGVCGGGYYAHRYSRESGFENPSVYCADLKYLFAHIRDRVRTQLSPAS